MYIIILNSNTPFVLDDGNLTLQTETLRVLTIKI